MNNREQILHFYLMGWEDCQDTYNHNFDDFLDNSIFSRAYRYGWMDCREGYDMRQECELDVELIELMLSDD